MPPDRLRSTYNVSNPQALASSLQTLSLSTDHCSPTWRTRLRHNTDLTREFFGPIKSKVLRGTRASTTPHLFNVYTHARTAHPYALPATNISVREFLSSGRINDGFAATADGVPLVTKFAFPSVEQATCSEAENEAYIYHHQLKNLQGTIVPKWYAMWWSLQPNPGGEMVEVLCTVQEDAGAPLSDEAIRSLSVKEKNVIINKYRQLHAAGVIHRSAHPKHWVRHGRMSIDTLRLIDFGLSLRVDAKTVDTAGFQSMALGEIHGVCNTLHLSLADLQPAPPTHPTAPTQVTNAASGIAPPPPCSTATPATTASTMVQTVPPAASHATGLTNTTTAMTAPIAPTASI